MSPDDPRHGTFAGYYAHRMAGQVACASCKRAAAATEARRQMRLSRGIPGRIDATGTRRRLQALALMGWSWVEIGRRIDADPVLVSRWATRDDLSKYVFRSTVERVSKVYDQLSMTRPPERTTREKAAATKMRRMADRRGWAPPLAWEDIDDPDERPNLGGHDTGVDEVVVSRLLAGRSVASSNAEKREAMRRWLRAGGTEKALCDAHGWRSGRYTSKRQEDAA